MSEVKMRKLEMRVQKLEIDLADAKADLADAKAAEARKEEAHRSLAAYKKQIAEETNKVWDPYTHTFTRGSTKQQ